ncbi:Lrp/AsnC ligand binding domain-containing protein [Fulvivirgaceae bacterium BMA12]|uniref:Lrp/AsnC ligand binding domain-containing protein n=1 Tax=Agaribacillus aureus TaxID=3051825 RepID=A0ABT8LFS7_9BACT|nr:Lrp/AsnC ligand binding domain-containing protein [Fulvivirgaceae bacterium BMA12]
MEKIDTIDKTIIKKLLTNARIAYSQLAKEIGVSNTLVHKKVNRLRQLGILKSPTFILDAQKLGFLTEAYTTIKLDEPKHVKTVIKELEKIPEVISCSNITGEYTLIIRIFARDNDKLREVLYNKIHLISGVVSTDTVISFETSFEKQVPIE